MAEQVTISTFLELKDNMSDGLKKVEAALKRVGGAKATHTKADKEQVKLKKEQEKAAEKLAKMQQRAARFEEQAAKRRQREFDANAKKAQAASDRAWRDIQKQEAIKRTAAIKTQAAISRAHLQAIAERKRAQVEQERIARRLAKAQERIVHKAAQEQERTARRLAKAQERERKEIARSMLGPKHDPWAQAKEQVRIQQVLSKAEAVRRREQEKSALAVQRAQEKAARADAKRAAFMARQAQRSKKERADFIGKAGAAMFGAGPGGFLSAAFMSPMAAVSLGVIGIVDSLVSGIGTAISAAFDLTKSFVGKVFDLNKEYQMTVRRVANSLVSLNYVPTFDIAQQKAESLFNIIREKAAVLPGEAQDYLEVFSMGLPMALAQGERDLDRFAEKTSKFAAYALSRGIKDVQHIARDYSRILQGRPTFTTRMYSELLPFTKMQAIDFRKLAPVERMELFYEAIEKASVGFKNMEADADAVMGTMNSLIDIILQKGGKPLFESSLAIIQRINTMLKDNNSVLSRTITLIGTSLGNVLEGAFSKVESIFSGMVDINEQTLKAVGVTGWWAEKLLDAMSVFRDLQRAGEAARAQRTLDELDTRRQQEAAIKGTPEYQRAVQSAPGVMAAPQTAGSFGITSGGGRVTTSDRSQVFKGTASLDQLSKWALDKKKGAGALSREAWTLALRGQGLSNDDITRLWQQKEALQFSSLIPTGGGGGGGGRGPRGAPSGRQTTINDFRYSKFDIRQEFAEGFDPDRIAVAFASDLSKLGEMRMQSAYAPLYTSRY